MEQLEKKEGLTTDQETQLVTFKQDLKAIDEDLTGQTKYTISIDPESLLIVLGGEKTLELAEYELAKAKKISPEATIYKKRNSYRTIIANISSKEEQSELLLKAKKEFGDAYPVREKGWCSEVTEFGEYFICKENK